MEFYGFIIHGTVELCIQFHGLIEISGVAPEHILRCCGIVDRVVGAVLQTYRAGLSLPGVDTVTGSREEPGIFGIGKPPFCLVSSKIYAPFLTLGDDPAGILTGDGQIVNRTAGILGLSVSLCVLIQPAFFLWPFFSQILLEGSAVPHRKHQDVSVNCVDYKRNTERSCHSKASRSNQPAVNNGSHCSYE